MIDGNSKYLIEMTNISKNYSGVKALDKVNINIKKEEIHCLVGENGSGKSTLIKILSGVILPDSDSLIRVNGEITNQLNPSKSIDLGIQVIYQDHSLFPNLSVLENIGIEQYYQSPFSFIDKKKMKNKVIKILNKIKIKFNLYETLENYSIADRQIIAICRALFVEAKLLIMDEPTASLTRQEVKSLFSIVKELNNKGMSIIFVSHKLDEILEVADKVTVIRDGKNVGTFQKNQINTEKLVKLMTGKAIKYNLIGCKFNNEVEIFKVNNLCKKGEYNNISFKLMQGEVIGLIGLLGSGRTEFALSVFGMNKPDSGEIFINKIKVKITTNEDAIKNGIGYLPEDRLTLGLVMEQSTENNLVLTILNILKNKLRLISPSLKNNKAYKEKNKLNIKIADINNPVNTLSGGNQQKVVLSKWLSCNPYLLILDSPTVGVDVGAKEGIYNIINKLSEDGISIILISDEVKETLYNTHKILVIKNGEISHRFLSSKTNESQLYNAING